MHFSSVHSGTTSEYIAVDFCRNRNCFGRSGLSREVGSLTELGLSFAFFFLSIFNLVSRRVAHLFLHLLVYL